MRLREVRPEHIATSCNRVQVVVFLCQFLLSLAGKGLWLFHRSVDTIWTSVLPATNHQPFTRLSFSMFLDRSASKRYPGTLKDPVT